MSLSSSIRKAQMDMKTTNSRNFSYWNCPQIIWLWLFLMCVFRLSFLLSLWSQKSHWSNFSLLWADLMCRVSLNLLARTLGQLSHWTFNISLYSNLSCSLMLHSFSCFSINFTSAPHFEQVSSFLYFLSPCLLFMWPFKENTDSEHISHWTFCCVWVNMWVFRV